MSVEPTHWNLNQTFQEFKNRVRVEDKRYKLTIPFLNVMVDLALGLVLLLLWHAYCFVNFANYISNIPINSAILWSDKNIEFSGLRLCLLAVRGKLLPYEETFFFPQGEPILFATFHRTKKSLKMLSSRNSLGYKEDIVVKGQDSSLRIQRWETVLGVSCILYIWVWKWILRSFFLEHMVYF